MLVASRSAEVLAELEKQAKAKAMSSVSEEKAADRLGTQPVTRGRPAYPTAQAVYSRWCGRRRRGRRRVRRWRLADWGHSR
jgi:hypothetical protein